MEKNKYTDNLNIIVMRGDFILHGHAGRGTQSSFSFSFWCLSSVLHTSTIWMQMMCVNFEFCSSSQTAQMSLCCPSEMLPDFRAFYGLHLSLTIIYWLFFLNVLHSVIHEMPTPGRVREGQHILSLWGSFNVKAQQEQVKNKQFRN